MSSRGIILSMLSRMKIDVGKPLADLQLQLVGKGSGMYLEHKKLMKKQEAEFEKAVMEGEEKHRGELRKAAMVESLDDSVYDEVRRKRREEKVAAEMRLRAAEERHATIKFLGRKGVKPLKIKFSKKQAKIAEERDNLALQRILVKHRQEDYQHERLLTQTRQTYIEELSKAKSKETEIELLLKRSERALQDIKELDKRSAQSHSEILQKYTAEERLAQQDHFKKIEEHTKAHLDKLAAIAKAPNFRLTIMRATSTYLRVMIVALYGYIAYEIASTLAEV
eukprot:TRINITY_DN14377_c0_g1_i1.p1 TRINITY_DN14377_c0_g1~~TRINITY_DN14377_c0_g1_i1.p1  ORF type:complete len:299 (+),score=91.63 TRINITY_DN14377_c0_g1_i1:59-898(+)